MVLWGGLWKYLELWTGKVSKYPELNRSVGDKKSDSSADNGGLHHDFKSRLWWDNLCDIFKLNIYSFWSAGNEKSAILIRN